MWLVPLCIQISSLNIIPSEWIPFLPKKYHLTFFSYRHVWKCSYVCMCWGWGRGCTYKCLFPEPRQSLYVTNSPYWQSLKMVYGGWSQCIFKENPRFTKHWHKLRARGTFVLGLEKGAQSMSETVSSSGRRRQIYLTNVWTKDHKNLKNNAVFWSWTHLSRTVFNNVNKVNPMS